MDVQLQLLHSLSPPHSSITPPSKLLLPYSLAPHSFSLLTPHPLTPSPLNSLPPHTIPQLTIALTAAILQNMLPLLDTIARIEAPVVQLAEEVDRGLAFFNATNVNSSSLILIAYSIARETATGLAGKLPYTFVLMKDPSYEYSTPRPLLPFLSNSSPLPLGTRISK